MPKLWEETIDAHRMAVREATLDATAALVTTHGLASVTMSQIAKDTGIGRATLYKYFPDVDAILTAWHERQVRRHLSALAAISDQAGSAAQRVEAVLHAYAAMAHQRHGGELATLLHQGEHVARAQQELTQFLAALISEGAKAGQLRADVASVELANYCLYSLAAASRMRSKAAVHRLVTVTLDGLRPG